MSFSAWVYTWLGGRRQGRSLEIYYHYDEWWPYSPTQDWRRPHRRQQRRRAWTMTTSHPYANIEKTVVIMKTPNSLIFRLERRARTQAGKAAPPRAEPEAGSQDLPSEYVR